MSAMKEAKPTAEYEMRKHLPMGHYVSVTFSVYSDRVTIFTISSRRGSHTIYNTDTIDGAREEWKRLRRGGFKRYHNDWLIAA